MEAPVMVEAVRIPLKARIDHDVNEENENTGFPFDETDFGERDRSFRSHIDDIVQRHPELAEHLNFDRNFDRFPFRSNTWGNKRRGSGDESKPSGSADPYTESRRFGRPFGSRLNDRFHSPFSKTFDGEPEYQQKSQTRSQAEPVPQEQPKEEPPEKKLSNEEKPPQIPVNERGRKQHPNIPQSSTVDLGQKQEPVFDSREQRSMSAPPENRTKQQRFVSSINIPIQSTNISGGDTQPQPTMSSQPQPPQPKPSQQSKSNTRVIPIHVEGRDEPVVPKNANQTFTQPPPQPERVFPTSQPDRGFAQRPFANWERSQPPYYTGDQYFPRDEQFYPGESQYFEGAPQFFMNRAEAQHQQRPNPEEYFTSPFKQQQAPQQQQPSQQQSEKPQTPPVQQQTEPPPASNEHQQTPPPQPSQKAGPIGQIQCIQKDVLQLMDKVEKFNGKPKDKEYIYLDEMLTRNLLKLDDVETEGKENIRLARKEAINCIQKCISILEAKAAANEQLRNQLMDVDKKIEPLLDESALTSLEVSGIARSGSETQQSIDGAKNEQAESVVNSATPMEIAPSSSQDNIPVEPTSVQMSCDAEIKNADESATLDGQQGENYLAVDGEFVEQPTEDAANISQTVDSTKEEVKDKKEKKKVKKKTDKADK